MSNQSKISRFAEKVRNLLTGEPLRAISYGSIAVVYLVVKAQVALGLIEDAPDFDGIAVAVTAAVALVTEIARRFTFSPNTVNQIVTEETDVRADLYRLGFEAGVRSERQAAKADG